MITSSFNYFSCYIHPSISLFIVLFYVFHSSSNYYILFLNVFCKSILRLSRSCIFHSAYSLSVFISVCLFFFLIHALFLLFLFLSLYQIMYSLFQSTFRIYVMFSLRIYSTLVFAIPIHYYSQHDALPHSATLLTLSAQSGNYGPPPEYASATQGCTHLK